MLGLYLLEMVANFSQYRGSVGIFNNRIFSVHSKISHFTCLCDNNNNNNNNNNNKPVDNKNRLVDEEGKPVGGYRRSMQNIWKERYGTEITEQCVTRQG